MRRQKNCPTKGHPALQLFELGEHVAVAAGVATSQQQGREGIYINNVSLHRCKGTNKREKETKRNPGFMSSCTAEKTLKASGIFKKCYRLFNRTFFCVDNEGVWTRSENRLAAAAAIIVPARCHDWQRPLPIMGAAAPNPNGTVFFPAPPRPLPICSGRDTLKGHAKSKGQQEQPKQRMKRMTLQR